MSIEQARPATPSTSFDEQDQNLVRYLGLNPNSPADRAMVTVARHYDLDPLLKHVVVIPKGGVYLTRDGLLHIAHRSGQLDGIVVEQDPTLVDGEWVARVSVYRKDMRHPFTFPGRYPVNGGNRQYAQEMALKAAESHALRRAFDINGIPSYDEQRPERRTDDGERPSGADRMRAMVGGPQNTGVEVNATAAAPSPASGPKDVSEAAAPHSAADVPASTPDPTENVPLITQAQSRKMGATMRERGIVDRDDALAYVAKVIGRTVGSRNELTKFEAARVIDALEKETAAEAEVVEAEIVEETPAAAPPAPSTAEPDADAVWAQIVETAKAKSMTPADVEDDFIRVMGLSAAEASGAELASYLHTLTTGEMPKGQVA